MKCRLFVSAAVSLLVIATTAQAQTLAWDRNPESNVAGYIVEIGTSSRQYTQSVNVGNVTQWRVQGLLPDRAYYFAVRAYTYSGVRGGVSNEVAVAPVNLPRGADFSRDGRGDILWQNFSTGGVSLWRMQGITAIAGAALGPGWIPDSRWKIVGASDMNRDGHTDVLWQHDGGHVSVWYMRGETQLAGEVITQSPVPTGWRIVGTGDLDRDGSPDILWQHTDGTVSVWYMDRTRMRSAAIIVRLSDSRWRVVAAADFNRDGWLDLVWRHTSTGQNSIWFMTDRRFLSAEMISITLPDQNWQVGGVIDFNVDGYPDLIWRNRSTGGVAGWIMSVNVVVAGYWLNPGTVDTAWVTAGPK